MADDIDVLLGKNIRAKRLLRGLTQKELGARLGVSFQQVGKYELGMNVVCPKNLLLLTELFDCDLEDLFTLSEESDITSSIRLESAKIRSLVRSFIQIASPKLQTKACLIVQALADIG